MISFSSSVHMHTRCAARCCGCVSGAMFDADEGVGFISFTSTKLDVSDFVSDRASRVRLCYSCLTVIVVSDCDICVRLW